MLPYTVRWEKRGQRAQSPGLGAEVVGAELLQLGGEAVEGGGRRRAGCEADRGATEAAGGGLPSHRYSLLPLSLVKC